MIESFHRCRIGVLAAGAILTSMQALAAGAPPRPAAPLHVRLAPAVQRASGITVTRLKPVRYLPYVDAYARVVDLAPLFALRGRLRAAEARLGASGKEYERLKRLNTHGQNVSDKALQAAAAAWQADLAHAEALHAAALQQWGDTLARWLDGRPDAALAGLTHGSERLLSVSVPAGDGKRPIVPAAHIALAHGAGARLVSAAPQVDPQIQLPVFFYRTAAALPANYRFTVRMPVAAAAETGVRVPASAVLWYGGKAWVYVRTAAAQFERRPIPTDAPDGNGWFVAANLAPGSRLVVNGAELLFATEFKTTTAPGDAEDDDD